jgi:hypothetical protein
LGRFDAIESRCLAEATEKCARAEVRPIVFCCYLR